MMASESRSRKKVAQQGQEKVDEEDRDVGQQCARLARQEGGRLPQAIESHRSEIEPRREGNSRDEALPQRFDGRGLAVCERRLQ